MMNRIFFALAVVAAPALAWAADPDGAPRDRATRAVRKAGAITVDGRLDDAGWRGVPVASDFWQRSPKEGAPPGHATEFQIAYDDRALYVAVRAHDDDPAAIRRLLHRRDQESSADWVGVMIDSYHDRRTAFGFALNAAGRPARRADVRRHQRGRQLGRGVGRRQSPSTPAAGPRSSASRSGSCASPRTISRGACR
jgi:hypothetical protein